MESIIAHCEQNNGWTRILNDQDKRQFTGVVVSYPNYTIYISIFDAYVMKVIQLPMVGYDNL